MSQKKTKTTIDEVWENHPLWPFFITWARRNAINLEHIDDYSPWWFCFRAGARSCGKFLILKVDQ